MDREELRAKELESMLVGLEEEVSGRRRKLEEASQKRKTKKHCEDDRRDKETVGKIGRPADRITGKGRGNPEPDPIGDPNLARERNCRRKLK
jgi:hypothetical protein